MPVRCLRQFGYVQVIPPEPFIPKKVHRGPKPLKYVCDHDKMRILWDQWRMYVLAPAAYNTTRVRYPADAAPGYLEWFAPRSHLKVDPIDDDFNDEAPHELELTQMSDAAVSTISSIFNS